ncbi:MAG: PEP-CTERM sorting domain-containing protein [Candidatus Acidiferrales bacterium]
MRKFRNGFILLGLVCVAAVAPAKAGSILPKGPAIDFMSNTFPGPVKHPGGSVTFAQGYGSEFKITNAPISELRAQYGNIGPSPNGLYAIGNGTLNLNTGGCISDCTNINGAGFQGANFSGTGSSLTLKGDIASLGIGSLGDPVTLIQGYFSNLGSSAPPTHVSLNKGSSKTNPGGGGVNGYLVITYINPLLVAALGLNDGNGVGQLTETLFNLSYLTVSKNWNGEVSSSDVIVIPTPEPTTLMLFGTVLLALAWVTRRVRA